MEEIEVPTEHLTEEIQEKAEEKRERWTLYLALSTAFMAVLAAFGGLLAGHHANEALIERVKASDQWNFYQSKNLKQEIAANTDQILHALGKAGNESIEDHSKDIARYDKEKEEIKKKALEAEAESEAHLAKHIPFSRAVTAFQVAIAISAIAVLTRRKRLWYGGLLLTVVGIVFLVLGMLP
ncbi:MAG TPA: DUF4337 domain-containing protein [Puia sp.]|jgi:hypothetical protein